jgi:hypothetical protein
MADGWIDSLAGAHRSFLDPRRHLCPGFLPDVSTLSRHPRRAERRTYDALRESLAGDNLAARLYADWLKRFLDAVERFLGDAGGEGQRAFGLKKPAPLWTAPAFNRCLLLALIYPIVTIFLQVGPAEAALGLKRNVPGFSRGFGLVAIAIISFAIWRGWLTTGWKRLVWWIGAYAGFCRCRRRCCYRFGCRRRSFYVRCYRFPFL